MTDNSRTFHYRFPKFTEEKFTPYALAMGQANLAWNDLHEHMGRLFAVVLVTVGEDRGQGLAVWQVIKVDRAKRDCLEVAVKQLPPMEPWPRLNEDVLWLCDRVNSLEEDRNNIVHGPLLLEVGEEAFTQKLSGAELRKKGNVSPHILGGNTRASKMTGKNLLTEYRRVRDRAAALRTFAARMDDALNRPELPWPARPKGLEKSSPRQRPQRLQGAK